MGRCIFGMIAGAIGTALLLLFLFFAWKDRSMGA
jgi:hypothetical protein